MAKVVIYSRKNFTKPRTSINYRAQNRPRALGPTKPGCAHTMTVGSWSEWRATGRRPSLKSRRQPTKPAEVPTRLLTLSLSLSSPLCHEMGVINIAHRISHGMNVVVVSIQSNSSKKILLFADWLFTTTTFVPWDILWAMFMNDLLWPVMGI